MREGVCYHTTTLPRFEFLEKTMYGHVHAKESSNLSIQNTPIFTMGVPNVTIHNMDSWQSSSFVHRVCDLTSIRPILYSQLAPISF